MKIFETNKIRGIDELTLINEPISEIDLMERASNAFVGAILDQHYINTPISIFCGPGNNGGDGLAIARILSDIIEDKPVSVFILDIGKSFSPLLKINLERLERQNKAQIEYICDNNGFPKLEKEHTVIDALFGSGLTRPLSTLAADLVVHINNSGANVISVDIPSGLMGEDNSENNLDYIIKATQTITFQFPKLSFLLPENEDCVGNWSIVDIGLHPDSINNTPTNYCYLEKADIIPLIKKRARFSHKGTYGHALLISGSYGKMGAAILASKACLRSGVGLLTTHVPHNCYAVLQNAVPEAMSSIDESELMFTSISELSNYSAIGIGPAIGTKVNAQRGLYNLISRAKVPLLIDADGLNILSFNPEWMNLLPEGTILTPHPKEFDRLFGKSVSGWERLIKAKNAARKYKLIIVLKGAYTQIINTSGDVWFNSTGNPGMATAGSGDVLTGIILSWLAQGYKPEEAAKIGVFAHGLAGDIASEKVGYTSLIASDIVSSLHSAYNTMV